MIDQRQLVQLLSSYSDEIDNLFNILEGDKPSIKSGLTSKSATLVTTYDEDSGVQRAPAPATTKCFSGCGRRHGAGGGKTTVDILNSVGNMTANIINSVAGAAAVVVPPITNTLGNVAINYFNPGSKQTPQGQQQPPVVVYPPGGGGQQSPPPPAQGQWVWVNWKWVWVPAGQRFPPPPPQGQWVWANGKWMWVPAGQKPPPNPNQQPGQQGPQGPSGPTNANATATATAHGGSANAKAEAKGDNANATATATSYGSTSPSPTRSQIPQHISRQVSPASTRTNASRFSKKNHPGSKAFFQKAHQDIYKTLQDMIECADKILVKLN